MATFPRQVKRPLKVHFTIGQYSLPFPPRIADGAGLVVTHSGIRGRQLPSSVVEWATQGLVELLRAEGLPTTLGLARDEEPAAAELAERVAQAAVAAGADVVDFGVVSTPGAKLAARRARLGGAVIVTASHLGPEHAGLKLVAAPSYGPVDPRALPEPTSGSDEGTLGSVRQDAGAAATHAAAVLAAVDVERIRAAGLKASVSGGAGPAPTLVLAELRCAADPEPNARTDVGLELDPDGDRLQLVDETGARLDSECTLALAVLAREPRALVKGADTSRMVDDLVAASGGIVHTVAPGELHLVEGLATHGGDLAGEGNGGVIVPEVGLARDGLAAAAAILELMARTGRPLSALAGELPRYERRRSTVACATDDDARAALRRVASGGGASGEVARGVPVSRAAAGHPDPRTGVRVERDDAWALVRQSATEPVLRITVEARDASTATRLHDELRQALGATR